MNTHRDKQGQRFRFLTTKATLLALHRSLFLLSLMAANGAPANAQYYDALNGSSAQSGAFDKGEFAELSKQCNTMYANYLATDRQMSQSRSSGTAVSGSYSPTTISANYSTQDAQASASRNAMVNSTQGARNCDSIVGSYFKYKEEQLRSESTKVVGLANADAIKSVGLANADSNQEVGLANASTLKAVGLSNSNAQLYGGIASAAGGLLGSIFTSANQRAAIRAQVDADVAKTKIIADLELQKARLQYELVRAQSSYGAQMPTAQYQMPMPQYQQLAAPASPAQQVYAVQAVSPTQQAYPTQAVSSIQQSYPAQSASPIQQSYPASAVNPIQQAYAAQAASPIQQSYQASVVNPIQQAYPVYNAQPAVLMQTQAPNPSSGLMQASVVSVAPQASMMVPQKAQGQPPVSLSDALKKLGLQQNPDCTPAAVIIFSRNGARVCAYAKSILPAGQYLYEDGRLQKY